MWSCGSSSREMQCRKSAAAIPPPLYDLGSVLPEPGHAGIILDVPHGLLDCCVTSPPRSFASAPGRQSRRRWIRPSTPSRSGRTPVARSVAVAERPAPLGFRHRRVCETPSRQQFREGQGARRADPPTARAARRSPAGVVVPLLEMQVIFLSAIPSLDPPDRKHRLAPHMNGSAITRCLSTSQFA